MPTRNAVADPAMEKLLERLRGGDEAALGELLRLCAPRVEGAIRKKYQRLNDSESEDVVSEATLRFWAWHKKRGFKASAASPATMLFKFADQVAYERVTGRLLSQKQSLREAAIEDDQLPEASLADDEEAPDDNKKGPSPVQAALAECFKKLLPLDQDILLAIGLAAERDYPLEAADLGEELGRVHKDGVLIPPGTIRTKKSRAWDTLENCVGKKGFDLKALGYTYG